MVEKNTSTSVTTADPTYLKRLLFDTIIQTHLRNTIIELCDEAMEKVDTSSISETAKTRIIEIVSNLLKL